MEVALLTGSLSRKDKEQKVEAIAAGKVDVVVGTHALIQEGVSFASLGLSIVDEQHRFGVLQRGALAGKGVTPHVLVMTATPIPRTITLTLYGDLDVSVIDELPPGRKTIQTRWVRPEQRARVLDFIRLQVREGRQVYWVCPLVEDSETIEAASVQERFTDLSQVFPDFSVGLLHGQMSSAEKAAVLEGFRNGEVGVLVSTTVIEVGVDVSNATVMVIEDAQRFGLSQLHQLRGRVGRGEHGATCILLGKATTEDGAQRLQAMCATSDGFRIAEVDLKLRGPGEGCGIRQHGITDFRVADLVRDVKLLRLAREEATCLALRDPGLEEVPVLREKLVRTLGNRLDLAVTA
jgi:ATP-dependent DNA helicase RecG